MTNKLIRSLFLAAAIGFLIMWVLEFRRTTMVESYWLLLLGLTFMLMFQLGRLRQGMKNSKSGVDETAAKSTKKATK